LLQKINYDKPLTVNDMQQIQRDTVDLDAQTLMNELRGFVPQTKEQIQAWSYLKNWNGDMAANSQAAAIFQFWMRHFKDILFASNLKTAWKTTEQGNYLGNYGESVGLCGLTEILKQHNSPWCNDKENIRQRSCQVLLASSLQLAVQEIYKLKGDESMASWNWGELQKTVYTHTPFSNLKPLDKFFERRISNGGSENSINVAGSQFNEKEGYLQHFGPGFRQIISLDENQIVDEYINSTGQSGNLVSAHYADMVEPFHDGQYYLLDSASKRVDASGHVASNSDVKPGLKNTFGGAN
jgi:penicillin amidase